MLRTRPQIDADRVGLRQIVSLRVGVNKRTAAVPVLARRLRVNDEGIGRRALEDGVGFAGHMVGAGSVGERKPVGRVQPILILPRCCYNEVAEPVHRSAAPAGHMGDDAVEDLAAVLVRVEPAWTKSRMARPDWDRPQAMTRGGVYPCQPAGWLRLCRAAGMRRGRAGRRSRDRGPADRAPYRRARRSSPSRSRTAGRHGCRRGRSRARIRQGLPARCARPSTRANSQASAATASVCDHG